jgi:glycosyltransferase involved in cell wall biosynthesis
MACGCPLIVTDQMPEIAHRFPGVPVVVPSDVEGLRRRLDAALGGDVPTPAHGQMADYDWSNIACRYISLYQSALRRLA